jgi:hypothetical protein
VDFYANTQAPRKNNKHSSNKQQTTNKHGSGMKNASIKEAFGENTTTNE